MIFDGIAKKSVTALSLSTRSKCEKIWFRLASHIFLKHV